MTDYDETSRYREIFMAAMNGQVPEDAENIVTEATRKGDEVRLVVTPDVYDPQILGDCSSVFFSDFKVERGMSDSVWIYDGEGKRVCYIRPITEKGPGSDDKVRNVEVSVRADLSERAANVLSHALSSIECEHD